ncbi:molecular chaperone DjlA [Lamprobacter modestohalophilus]|uniref:Co-chaperone protein DjlA n=1 Tax=Lamprobacter modestohalophilus TaxID=1064514 RepID=A0A9X0WDJ4_9GAMM|nr:co-chaperone DjlA [Lamprobacter modestohalophilus]MBK1621200.1 molecular chaperone DjlA [Lamprobacter modestohalophilus]
MRWVGKVIGGFIGLAAGGPFGAMLGAALGHGVDQGLKKLQRNAQLPPGDRQRIQSAFFTATFSTMGHLSKADGRVSEAEIALAESIMTQLRLSPEMRSAAIKLFRLGKSADFDLPAVVETFRRECRGQRSLIQMFLEIQIQAAYVDGEPTFAQRQVLSQIRAGLNVPEILFKQLETLVRLQRNFAGSAGPQGAGSGAGSTGGSGSRRRTATHRAPNLREAYAVLGVTPKDSDATIKRAYRRLLSQHHPDKLVSKGLPEEMMKMATQKTHEIRRAYEMIQSARAA